MIVSWLPGSNEGFEQTFIVEWLNTNTQRTYYSLEIKDSDQKRIQQYIVKSLYPETMYVVHVKATNKHGTVRSTQNANCTTGLGMFILFSHAETCTFTLKFSNVNYLDIKKHLIYVLLRETFILNIT